MQHSLDLPTITYKRGIFLLKINILLLTLTLAMTDLYTPH